MTKKNARKAVNRGEVLARTRAKRKPGRPPVLTAEVEAALLDLVVAGTTPMKACERLKISYSTVGRREIDDALFEARMSKARRAGAAYCLDEAEEALRSAKDGSEIMRARELAIHLRWKASKLLPKYADGPASAVQVNVGTPIDPARRDQNLLELARSTTWLLAEAGRVAEQSRVAALLPAPAEPAKDAPVAQQQPANAELASTPPDDEAAREAEAARQIAIGERLCALDVERALRNRAAAESFASQYRRPLRKWPR